VSWQHGAVAHPEMVRLRFCGAVSNGEKPPGLSWGRFTYLFNLENFLAAIDDTPAEIEIAGERSQCSVMAVHGLEVQIALERDYGHDIAEARLQTNMWFLLESLRKKFEDLKSNPGKNSYGFLYKC
jgi:hypothetical protein